MKWYIISLTITAFYGTTHESYLCYLYTEANGKHETVELPIDKANKLMWELKKKGWETTTHCDYNTYSPRVYTRRIKWLHIDDGVRDD